MEELAPVNDISQISALLRNGDTQRIFQSQRGSHGMRGGTNPADSLRKIHSVEGASSSSIFSKPLKSKPSVLASATMLLSMSASICINPLIRVTVDDNSSFCSPLRCTITDERLHFVGEPKHGAADTGTVVADGPIHAIVPFPDRAVDSVTGPLHPSFEHAGFSPSFEAKIP